jgi:hypothetical protein
LASSPVLSRYFLGYWKETPEATSLYVTVAGRFFTVFLGVVYSFETAAAGTAAVEATVVSGLVIWLEPLVEGRGDSFDLEQPTTTKLVKISKPDVNAATGLRPGAYR